MLAVEPIPQTGTYRLSPPDDQFVLYRDAGEPYGVRAQARSVIDGYNVRPLDLGGATTSVLYTLQRTGSMVLSLETPIWESWLGEMGQVVSRPRPRPRTAIGDQIEEIHRLTGLGDGQFAAAIPGGVSRETVNRWRNRSDSNVRPENAYRIGLILELSRRMEAAGIEARVWLHQAARDGEPTPFELLCAGRLGDVRQAVENVAAGAEPLRATTSIPDGHRQRDAVMDDAEEDEGWAWGERDQDAGA
jgi:hypothetical protein